MGSVGGKSLIQRDSATQNLISVSPYIIERNEYGEILFKFSGNDKERGRRVVGMEISARSLKQAMDDIRANGYTVSRNRILPSKLFDDVMNNTDGEEWHWEDATKEMKKILKGV